MVGPTIAHRAMRCIPDPNPKPDPDPHPNRRPNPYPTATPTASPTALTLLLPRWATRSSCGASVP